MVNNFEIDSELIKKVRSLVSQKDKYYVERNRDFLIDYEEDYHATVTDPDGKKRNMLDEREIFLSNTKEVTYFLSQCIPGKILDFGCGLGWFLSSLNDEWTKHGLEISKFASKYASQFGNIFNNDLNLYSESDFDVVIMYHVIEHLKNPLDTIIQLKNKMKKGGKIIVGTPDFDSIAARIYQGNFRLIKDRGHISLFSTDSLIRLFRDLNFKILDIQYPYFETSWYHPSVINQLKNKSGEISPPFYGSVITIFCEKE